MKITVKPVMNKSNGQVNISLPKKVLTKRFLADLDKIKDVELKIDKWSLFDDGF